MGKNLTGKLDGTDSLPELGQERRMIMK